MRQVFSCYRCAPIFKICTQSNRNNETYLKQTWLLAMAAVVTVYSAHFNEVVGQVQERARWLLPDVAKVTLDASGKSQIDFNPAICRRLGPELCEYFRAHEYGHVNLRHLERGVPTRQAEREADIWAATNASSSAVEAARRYFENGRGGSRFHGSAQDRARRIREVQIAKSNENSLENRLTYLKPTVGTTAKTTSATTAQTPYQFSNESRTTVVLPTIAYRTKGRTTKTSTKTRAPIQYSGGSRLTVVRKAVPQRTKIVIDMSRAKPNNSRSYYEQGYVPKGDFNNPNR